MFIVLDYAENGNLYSLLHKKKKFSEPDAFIFFYQTALALNYLHQNDIVHRDLKVYFSINEALINDCSIVCIFCTFGLNIFFTIIAREPASRQKLCD